MSYEDRIEYSEENREVGVQVTERSTQEEVVLSAETQLLCTSGLELRIVLSVSRCALGARLFRVSSLSVIACASAIWIDWVALLHWLGRGFTVTHVRFIMDDSGGGTRMSFRHLGGYEAPFFVSYAMCCSWFHYPLFILSRCSPASTSAVVGLL
ncbi:hypothetical protein BJX61DRAFT_492212 [Aspergillus egyptiacus]|nr:hypothetical protein BJX61DRAFT_492212 [Aspergillus egyptiacus]